MFEYVTYPTFYAQCEDAALRCPHGGAATAKRRRGGKKSWLALLCGRKSQGWFILHRFSLPVAQAPTLIESDSLNQKVNNPSSIDSGFNLSAAEIT